MKGHAIQRPDIGEGSDKLPVGAVVTPSGRISAATSADSVSQNPPFTRHELVALDETLSEATDLSLIRFSVYIGDLGDDASAGAAAVLPKVPEPEHACLIAVSPNAHEVVVVSGRAVADRVNDRVAQLGVTAAISAFRSGELIDGVISAIRVIATAAKRT
ncbi:DUF5130 family protein [Williamsia sterculiae]|uniref:DUF5130 family protein n=1 Tax=Williamsia sterculiae TaxID=1344003 RepID=UPI00389ADDFF